MKDKVMVVLRYSNGTTQTFFAAPKRMGAVGVVKYGGKLFTFLRIAYNFADEKSFVLHFQEADVWDVTADDLDNGPPKPAEPEVLMATPDMLVAKMRNGAKMRPVTWDNAALMENGYCYIRDTHVFCEHTPRTVSVETSPAVAGAKRAIEQYGTKWIVVE